MGPSFDSLTTEVGIFKEMHNFFKNSFRNKWTINSKKECLRNVSFVSIKWQIKFQAVDTWVPTKHQDASLRLLI